MCVVGAVVGFFVGKLGARASSGIPGEVVLISCILFIPSFFLVIGLHELGHALAGRVMNFDFRMYVVGPFMWVKERSRLVFKWNKNLNVAGGLVVSMPIGTDNLRNRFSIYAFGGPLASMVVAALAYSAYRLVDVDAASGLAQQTGKYFLLVTALLSVGIFVVTVTPLRSGGFLSDGARILRLQRGGEISRFEVLMLKIISEVSGGTRPRNLDMKELLEANDLARKLNDPYLVYINSFYYQAAFDRGDLEQAELHLKEYIGRAGDIPEGIRSSLWLEAAFFYAYGKNDLETSLQYWAKFKPSAVIPKAQVLATEACIAYLKDERGKASVSIDEALHGLPQMIDQGHAVALEERLMTLKAKLESH